MAFPEDFINKIHCGDVLEVLATIPDASVDLVVTSPPYNIGGAHFGSKWPGASIKDGYAEHDDLMPPDEYIAWQRKCIAEMLRVTADHGAVFYNHKYRIQNGLLDDKHEIVEGFPLRQIIIWCRKGGMNFNRNFFLPTYEVVYLFAKPKFSLVDKANALTDVWDIQQEMDNKHPAPFPVELPYRIIKSTDAQIVLDPFMGSGTTALACQQLERKFIGIEKCQEYCDMANKRISSYYSVDMFDTA